MTQTIPTADYPFVDGYPLPISAAQARDDALFQRAVTAYRFWYPTVSAEGVFQGNRDVGIADGEGMGLVAAGPRQVGFTLNSDTPYGATAIDLTDGPVVVDIPPGPYIGLVDDRHQRWILDLGIPGPDQGKGGRHLILPPGYEGEPPPGFHVGRSATNLVLLAIRALPLDGDMPKALAALRAVKVHPLDAPDRLLEYTDNTARAVDASCLRWENGLDFWRVLHTVLDAEPVTEEFRPMHGLLTALGIGKGRPFAPDDRTAAILERAAVAAKAQMLISAFASDRPDRLAWPDRRWEWVGLVPDDADFETPAGLDLEARDRWFIQAIVASPAMFRRSQGAGSLYWLGLRDTDGAYLDGGAGYRLTVPAPVPAELFWSVTVYDAQTRSEVTTAQDKAALRSLVELADITPGVPIDLYFGPSAPPQHAGTRWIQTEPGRGWFAYFRIYGPQPAAFDGGWKPGDFERL
ncbi:DUF1214 domain-containing protein [Phytomonospora sp. NPDC050363]|uniref:DUF1214 domain-containing protein n=1 Tax=Phytomonospora sp. NPDC050363 TaxID=3155642 RepID=UPI0034089E3D